MTTRRDWLRLTTGVLLAGIPVGALRAQRSTGAAAPRPTGANANAIEVWKSPTCGCCAQWVTHMRTNGFVPTVHDVEDVAVFKRKLGVPAKLESCHTAVVGGYAFEGHVPADLVRQVLKQRPAILGLAVPGMPMGSPGMEGPRKDAYDVVAFDKTGKTSVFAKR
jgi:hypothetical protein